MYINVLKIFSSENYLKIELLRSSVFTRINIFDEVINLFALFKANKLHEHLKKAPEFFCEENLKSTCICN